MAILKSAFPPQPSLAEALDTVRTIEAAYISTEPDGQPQPEIESEIA